MKEFLSISVMVLSAACFAMTSCSGEDGGSQVDTEVLGNIPQFRDSSSTVLISKEDMPSWLNEKTIELEKDVPQMAIYKLYQCNWRSQTIYCIYNNFSSCMLCETFYADGRKVEWAKTTDAEDFCKNSSCWKCIYVISNIPANVLTIQSNNDKQGNASAESPRCYMGRENRLEDDSLNLVHYMKFTCGIKGSTVFDGLEIIFEDSLSYDFKRLKIGDKYDIGQFKARAVYVRTWTEKIIKMALSQSGVIEVTEKKTVDGKFYITICLQDFKFNAIDKSCLYTIDGTLDCEILGSEEKDDSE